jgi:hypothetical protein
MAKIRMVEDHRGSPDGIRVLNYHKDDEFVVGSRDMSLELAKVFCNELHVAKAFETDGEELQTAQPPQKGSGKAGPSETK